MTENIEKINTPEELLAEFQQEAALLKEQQEKGTDPTRKSVHFEGIDVSELTLEDKSIWDKIRDESITEEDLNKHFENLKKEEASKSRRKFFAFIGNKAFVIFGNRQLRETKEEKKGEVSKLDISELTKEDMSILKKIDSKSITPEELRVYLEKFEKEKIVSRTRKVFVQIIRNKARLVLGETK